MASEAAPPAPFEVDVEAINALPPEKRRQELAKVAAFKQEIEKNPLWAFVPHDGDGGVTTWGQQGYLSIQTFIGAYVAGNRAGKTHVGAGDLLVQTLGNEWLPPWLRPYKRWDVPGDFAARVVVVDLPILKRVMFPKLRKLIPPGALWKGEFDKSYNDRDHQLRFADGSYWEFLSHDMDIDAFSGASLHHVWFDEEPPGQKGYQQFDESLARLIDTNGQCRFTLTPLLGLGWLFGELADEHGNPRIDEEVTVISGNMDHNPHTSVEMKERLKARWQARDPLKVEARVKGRWIHFAGMIYDEFKDAPPIVIPDRPIPREGDNAKPSVPIYCGIDAGINEDHKAALVFAWLDSDDVLEVFWAQKFADLDVAQVAEIYWAALDQFNFKPRWNVIDPSAQNRNAATGRSIQWAFSQQGIHTIPGQNNRQAGYNEIKNRLRTERLVIHSSLEPLRDEFLKYRWKTRKGQSEDAPKAEPIKINDDLLDALRYLAMSMPNKASKPKSEEEGDWKRQLVRDHIKSALKPPKRRIGATR